MPSSDGRPRTYDRSTPRSAKVGLVPDEYRIPVRAFVKATEGVQVHVRFWVPVVDFWVDFTVDIPLGDLTHYGGGVHPYFVVEDPDQTPEAHVKLMLRPETKFFENWYGLIQTDYRHYFAREFKKGVQKYKDKLAIGKLCKIPFLGWFVCGVIDMFGTALAYALGAALDCTMSLFLTGVVMTIGKVVLQIMKTPRFRIFQISQKKMQEKIALPIKDAAVCVVDNGRGGELDFRLWFDSMGLPVPPLPTPIEEPEEPEPPEPIAPPDLVELPQYASADFQPALELPVLDWSDLPPQSFSLDVEAPTFRRTGILDVEVEPAEDRWILRQTARTDDNDPVRLWGLYDRQTLVPLRRESIHPMADGQVMRQVEDYTVSPDRVRVSLGLDGGPSQQRELVLREGVPRELEDLWVFRFAQAPLAAGMTGTFGRLELSDWQQYSNWYRQIPVSVSVSEDTTDVGHDICLPVWRVDATDEECSWTLLISTDGKGLLRATCTKGPATLQLERLKLETRDRN